jgi:hypothetical protein
LKKKGPKIAIFIEAKSGQFFNFYDQIQVTRIVHLAYYNMCEFCTIIPISLFITKIQNLKWGCKTFWRVLYYKPKSGKRWKDVNFGAGQLGRSMYSSFIYRLKPGFGRFFRGACNHFWNVLLRKNTQVWENDVLMITGLQAYKTTGDALTPFQPGSLVATQSVLLLNPLGSTTQV